MKEYAKSMPCRECIYRKNSLAEELLGSFENQRAYYFVIKGVQYYCQKECQNAN